MYARITRVKANPADEARLTEQLKTRMVPVFEAQPGYLGVVNAVDRTTGEGATTTYWDTWENLKASEAAIFAARDAFAQDEGSEVVSFHRCEIPVFERKGDPSAGSFGRVTAMMGVAPEHIDEAIRGFREDAAPRILEQPGALAAIFAVDRENGITFGISAWDTAEHRDASEAIVREGREAAAKRLNATPMTMLSETTLVDLKIPART